MQQKVIRFKTRGMSRDLSESSFNTEFAFENMNLRMSTNDDNTTMSLVNEKGPLDTDILILGIPLGYAIIDKYVVLFTKGAALDIIYLLSKVDGEVQLNTMYGGQLGFDYKHPIETLPLYENENAIKVYWTDGLNLPRVINIARYLKDNDAFLKNKSNTLFDFIPTLLLNERCKVERNSQSSGLFSPGTIQYVCTYFNKYGQETNIFWKSSLHYISLSGRGASPEDRCSSTFAITLEDLDNHFDYVRIYSIHRTSIDNTPTVKRIIDLKYDDSSITYVDDGKNGDIIDPTVLLYIGGREMSAGTMEQKDGTLFLGDIKDKGQLIDKSIKDLIKSCGDNFEFVGDEKSIDEGSMTGTYPYTNHLDKSLAEISTFKYGEEYRFGILLLKKTGEWTEPIHLTDKENNILPNQSSSISDSINYLTTGKLVLPDNVIKELGDYVAARPLVVFPETSDRNIIAQGVLNPTVFNTQDRATNSPYAQSSWFFRPNPPVIPILNNNYYFFFVTGSKPVLKETNLNYRAYDKKGSVPVTVIGFHKGSSYYIAVTSFNLDALNFLNLTSEFSKAEDNYIYLGSAGGDVNDGANNHIFAWTSQYVLNNMQVSEDGELQALMPNVSINIPNITTWAWRTPNIEGVSEPLKEASVTMLDTYGSELEFRHFHSLPENTSRSCEIQCNNIVKSNVDFTKEEAKKLSDLFFIDLSILTFNSPDIEFSTDYMGINEEDVRLKLVGYIPITGTIADLDITTSTPALTYRSEKGTDRTVAPGFYKESVGETNVSMHGYKGLITTNAWLDEIYSSEEDNVKVGEDKAYYYNKDNTTYGFPIYPWHRDGSLNNQSRNSGNPDNKKDEKAPTNYRSAKLKNKKMSNLRFSTKPVYFLTGISYVLGGVQMVNSDQMTLTRIKDPHGQSINYYGNIDKLITNTTSWAINTEKEDAEPYIGQAKEKESTFIGYRLAITYGKPLTDKHNLFGAKMHYLKYEKDKLDYWRDAFSTDPIRIKYKSSPHIVLSLKSEEESISILPTLMGLNSMNGNTVSPFWNRDKHFTISLSDITKDTRFGWLWLAELVRTNVPNRFGGTSDNALENNKWLVAGDSVRLDGRNEDGNVELKWTQGDTYFQRYDCLKTYPFTLEDTNSVVDILSFMCETKINLDGRYDRNRGQVNNLTMMPSNFNRMNEVYSQRDNFFDYRILDNDLFTFESYPYTVTWTKTKSLGEKVDTWANITMASTIDFDGNKGKITKLKKFNDNLLAFQERGISHILYNEQMQISTLEGVPIEISNSNKVTGKRYISDKIGCVNKFSMCESPEGIYFVDDYTKAIYKCGALVDNLSDNKGFRIWVNEVCTRKVWNPVDFGNIVTYYDDLNHDVLFINNNTCLAFSEGLDHFSSFYNYEGTPYFINWENESYWIRKSGGSYKLWKHNAGEYNNFFGEIKPYWTTVLANPDPTLDKVFSTLDFRSDSWKGDINQTYDTYDTVEAWNEYQKGIGILNNQDIPLSLKKKFRIWRALIPRNNIGIDTEDQEKAKRVSRDRMRNPWLYLKLKKSNPGTEKTVLHDIQVYYFE